ncbi:MAG: hypothetical protein ACHQ4H_04470 [Ktedonobacterales bacterium]
MRIERLPHDNQRTQGPEQRDFYRQQSADHLRAIERLAAEALAARGTAPARAVILGAGACTELPLARIAGACEQVALVDLDAPGMERARNGLPPALRSRVQPITADLTGGVSNALTAELQSQPWTDLAQMGNLRDAALIEAATGCLERCAIAGAPRIAGLLPGTYGLVISSLTLTQLFSLPLLDIVDHLARVAPGAAELRETSPRYVTAARAFRRRVALAHLELIASLLASGGAALLISDVTGYLLPPRDGAHASDAAEAFAVLPADVLDLATDLAPRFVRIGRQRRWRWLAAAPRGGQPGRAYEVAGQVLRLRDA